MRYEISGKELRCSHCEYVGFDCSSAQLNTAMMTLLDIDWLNASATVFACQNCGKLEWFASSAKIVELDDLTETECLACNNLIVSGESACRKCGWSYEIKE